MTDIRKMTDELAVSLLEKRIVLLDHELNPSNARFVHTALLMLDGESSKPIEMRFRSGGGNASVGLMIYDTIRALRSPVTAFVFTAGSAASVILQGCDRRVGFKSSAVLVHSVGPSADGLENLRYNKFFHEQIRSMEKSLSVMQDRIFEIYLARTKMVKKKLKKVMLEGDMYERWVYGKEALELGLIDEVTDSEFKFDQLRPF
jgi:ATP-dependent Clp protease protease subunit